jgi:hypothetical protein
VGAVGLFLLMGGVDLKTEGMMGAEVPDRVMKVDSVLGKGGGFGIVVMEGARLVVDEEGDEMVGHHFGNAGP